jgi:hypothetical protein
MSKYLGKHLPYGVVDDGILVSYPLTSDDADGLGLGDIIGTGHTIDSNGFKPSGVAGNALYFNGAGASLLLQPDHTKINEGFSFSFELETQAITDLAIGSSTYLFAWSRTSGITAGFIKIEGHSVGDESFVISPRFTSNATDGTVALTTIGKGDTTKFEFSFRKGFLDCFVDNAWCASWPMQDFVDGGGSSILEFWLGGHPVLKGVPGYHSNLQINKRPVALGNDLRVPRISFVGDSILANGMWDGATDVKYKASGVYTTSTDDNHLDSGSSAECHRYFANKDMHTEIHCYADTSDTVEVTGTNDIMKQIDGTGTYDFKRSSSPWIVLLGGYNDLNAGALDFTVTTAGSFYALYKDLIDKMRERTPDAKILCLSTHCRDNNATYDTDAERTDTTNCNARILDSVNSYGSGVFYADWWTELGGLNIDSSDFDAADFHLSPQGSGKLGIFIASSIYNIEFG